MFDSVPVSTAFITNSEADSVARILETVGVIDEKCHVRDLLFPAECTKKQHNELRCPQLKQPNMKELICVRTDRCEQTVALTIEANHRLVNRDVTRFAVTVGLYIGFLCQP